MKYIKWPFWHFGFNDKNAKEVVEDINEIVKYLFMPF